MSSDSKSQNHIDDINRVSSVVPLTSAAAIKAEWFIALFCSAALVVLHIVFSTHAGPLWRDEAADVSFAIMSSWTEIWQHLHLDNFPPLLLVVLRAWSHLGWGESDMGYRLYGSLVGFGLIGVLWVVARIGGQRTPILGLILFGLTPYTIWFGDSIRPYGLGIAIIILTFGLVWRLIDTGSMLYFALATVTAILSVQTLYQNAALLLAIGLAGALVCLRRGRVNRACLVLSVGALAAVSLYPYLPLINRANEWSFVSRTGLSWMRLLTVATQALSAAGIFSFTVWVAVVVGSLIFVAAGICVKWSKNLTFEDYDRNLFAGLTIILSIVFFSMLLCYVGMPTQPWYYLAPMAIVAIASNMIYSVFFRWSRPVAIWLFLAVAMASALGSMPSTWMAAHLRQSNMDQIAALLEAQADKNDLIIVDPWMYGITFERYFHKPVKWITIPPMTDHRIHRYDLLKQQMEANNPLGPEMPQLAHTLQSGHRIWLVGSIIVPPDNKLPLILPPAPNSTVGWSEGDYQFSWSQQIGYFFNLRAGRILSIDIPVNQNINPFERTKLNCVTGWREIPTDR